MSDLSVKPNQDLTYSTDFRSVYSTVIRNWFDADPAPVLGGSYPEVRFV